MATSLSPNSVIDSPGARAACRSCKPKKSYEEEEEEGRKGKVEGCDVREENSAVTARVSHSQETRTRVLRFPARKRKKARRDVMRLFIADIKYESVA